MKDLEHQIAAWAEMNRSRAVAKLQSFNKALRGKDFITCDRFTFADIFQTVVVDFLRWVKVLILDDCNDLNRYHAAMMKRCCYQA